jgi:uncharacterized membrane protein (UPF0127 family)
MRRPVLLSVMVLLAVACGDGGGSSSAVSCDEVEPFGEFGEVAVEIDGEPTCLLLAQTTEQRARGLMEVTDLEGYPGMLFAYPADTSGAFWMRNTPMPLTIAYLDVEGRIVSTADMEPCEDSPDCPSYPAEGPFRNTVEVPQGRLADLGLTGDAVLTITGDTDPS